MSDPSRPPRPDDDREGIAALIAAGRAHHMAGRLDEASNRYEAALAQSPEEADALHLLGMLRVAQGRPPEGVALLRRASARTPNLPAVWYNLAIALTAHGEAEEAAAALQRAVTLHPGYVEAHLALAMAAKADGRTDDAVASLRHALAGNPRDATLLNRLGTLFADAELLDESEDCLRRAVTLAPNDVRSHSNLGILMQRRDRLDEAVACYRRACTLTPRDPAAHARLGTALSAQYRPEEAIACYEAVLALEPGDADALFSIGVLMSQLSRFGEAAETYQRALALRPGHARARFNLGLLRLSLGDFAAGWPDYEARWDTKLIDPSPHAAERRRWNGEPLAPDQTLLIYAEQGFGDTLQFATYLPRAAARAGRVILEVPPQLKSLLEPIPGPAGIYGDKEKLPPFDVQCALLSLPFLFETRLETIPPPLPLTPPPDRFAEWAAIPRASGERQIGVAWAGNPNQPGDRPRSMALATFRRILDIPGCRFHLLLPELRATDEAEFATLTEVTDYRGRIRDFADTAALISRLDLVVTTDTSVAHLAGAMGRPLWVLLSHNPDWRWLHDREDSPWYPTARLFRQTRPGDWDGVLAHVGAELARFAAQ